MLWELVCWVPNKTRPPLPCNSLDSNNQIAKLRHTAGTFAVQSSLPVLNMIAVDQLPAFDPMLTGVIHSKFIDHSYTSSKISSCISDLFPCTPSEDNLTQGTPPPNLYSMHYPPSFAFLSSLGDTSKLFLCHYDVKSWTLSPHPLSVMAKVADSHTCTWRQWQIYM